MIEDGYRCLITFARQPNISIWEVETEPSGPDNEEGIKTSNFRNVRYRTMAPRKLISNTPVNVVGAFDPSAMATFDAMCGQKDTITETHPDGSTQCYYGYLKQVKYPRYKEGDYPNATFTIVPTNWDPTNHVEAGPVWTSVSGT
jgi:hypothetical protein